MNRLTNTARTALQSGTIQLGLLCELDFSFGTERYWTGIHPLTYQGDLYTAAGDLGKVSDLESSQELRANGIELSLTLPFDQLTPGVAFQNVQSSDYKGRTATVTFAIFDESFQTVIHAMPRYYSMDALSYNIDPRTGALLTLQLESELLSAGKRQVKRWTDSQQVDDHPGDEGFRFLSYIASGIKIKWGTGGAFFQ